jgi:hypothetical protein
MNARALPDKTDASEIAISAASNHKIALETTF